MYVHVPKEKRTKLEPSGRKGILIGFSETVKGYKVYIRGQKQIELSRDVIFEEDIAFRRAKTNELDTFDVSPEETPTLEIQREFPEETSTQIEILLEIQEESLDHTKRPLWARKIIQEGDGFAAPSRTFRESNKPRKLTYNAFMCESLNHEPSRTSEALKHQAWKDAMVTLHNGFTNLALGWIECGNIYCFVMGRVVL